MQCSAPPQRRTMSPPTLLHSHTPNLPSPLVTLFTPQHRHRHRTTNLLFPLQNLTPPFSFSIVTTTTTLSPSSLSFSSPHLQPQEIDDDDDDEFVVGDCVVFEDGAFEDPYLQPGSVSSRRRRKNKSDTEPEDLVPESWKEVVEEINMTKKERRKIAQELEFGSRVVKKKRLESMPPRNVNVEVFNRYKETKLSQLRPTVLDSPTSLGPDSRTSEEARPRPPSGGSRVAPKDPRWAAYCGTMDDITEFFNSENYEPRRVAAETEGRGKLFTKEETLLLNARIPDLQGAASSKWLPLHTLAASGEFYLMDALLKHNVIDINGTDKDGLTALHRAIICKKQAITNYLLRESANPFVRDKEGASLMHYAVRTASVPAIKVLLLYNVDINLQDSDGWTPLHLAVQSRKIGIVRLLLIKGADETIKNVEGLTPLELCLYSGHDVYTYQLIKLLKQPPRPSTLGLSQIPVRSWKLPQSPVRNWKVPQSTVRNRKLPQRPLGNRRLRSPPRAVRNRRRRG